MDNKEKDNLYVNIISPPNQIKNLSDSPIGNASTDSFCIYAGQRHGVGSKIMNNDGSETICTENGTWQNVKKE